MHGIAIEAKRVMTDVDDTACAGLEERVWGGRYTPCVSFNPKLATKIVSPSNDEGWANIRRIAMPAGGKILVDLNRRVWEIVSERWEKRIEVVDEVGVFEG